MVDNGGRRRRNGRRWLWICAGLAAAGAVAAVLGIWHLPPRMYPADATEARAALQGGLLTAAAALTAVAGGLIALDETRQANAEVRRANEETRRANVAADGREREANANTHVRELYIAAIGLLSADTVDGRLGGIYALERVARDSADDQRTVVEVLSAFVREHTRPPADDSSPMTQPTTDVQAALTVLGRLPTRDGILRADLTGATLTGARLSGANLTGARLSMAKLTEVHLGEADLTGAGMSGTDLTGAWLDRTKLIDAWLGGANLTGAQLGEANLTGARLGGVNLAGAYLGEADLTGARLDRAQLTGAVLSEAKLTEARLDGADLTGAWLDRTKLSGAGLGGANLTGAQLRGADLTDVQGLVQAQVDTARGDGHTRLPEGLVRPAAWVPEEPPDGE